MGIFLEISTLGSLLIFQISSQTAMSEGPLPNLPAHSLLILAEGRTRVLDPPLPQAACCPSLCTPPLPSALDGERKLPCSTFDNEKPLGEKELL